MILGIDEIHKLIRKAKVFENLSERETKNPEGAGVDLRIGELYRIRGAGFLGVDDRHTPDLKLVARYTRSKKKTVSLRPGEYYVMTTAETVHTPKDILITFFPRSTLYRSGVMVVTGNCSPGYEGKLTFGIVNLGKKPFRLEMGARVVHAVLHKVKGKTNLYRGQWQGGRVTTRGKRERQI